MLPTAIFQSSGFPELLKGQNFSSLISRFAHQFRQSAMIVFENVNKERWLPKRDITIH